MAAEAGVGNARQHRRLRPSALRAWRRVAQAYPELHQEV